MTEIEKLNSCWTEIFQREIAEQVLLPKIKTAIVNTDKKPQDKNELYKLFVELYKIKMTKKYFLKSCELLGLEFETRVEIKANNLKVHDTHPPESPEIMYNPIPQTPQGPSKNFEPDFGGIVG